MLELILNTLPTLDNIEMANFCYENGVDYDSYSVDFTTNEEEVFGLDIWMHDENDTFITARYDAQGKILKHELYKD